MTLTRHSSRRGFNRRAFAVALLVLSAMPTVSAIADDEDETWSLIRPDLFENRPISTDGTVVDIEAPYRAHDAGLVPIKVNALIQQMPGRYIKALTLVIDENPAPIVGTFHISPKNGLASIATRVRINAYSNIRVIAELNTGELHMAKAFVKASGGCSAPATKDHELAMSRIGKMKFRRFAKDKASGTVEAQLMISHPNYTGMQTDQVTHHWIPSHYVKSIRLSQAGEEVLRFEGDISMSENPSIRFRFTPKSEGEIVAEVVDTKDTIYGGRWPAADPNS